MREYETTFIVQPEISDEGLRSITDRLDAVLAKNTAIRLLYDDQGRRRLAYEIQNFQKGRYVCLLYLHGGAVVPELERVLRLDDSVLRFLTVQVTDEVTDIEGRLAEAKEMERIQAERAAERAAREVEEAARVAAEEAARAAAAVAPAAPAEAADAAAPAADAAPGEKESAVAAASTGPADAAAASPEAAPAAESAPAPAQPAASVAETAASDAETGKEG